MSGFRLGPSGAAWLRSASAPRERPWPPRGLQSSENLRSCSCPGPESSRRNKQIGDKGWIRISNNKVEEKCDKMAHLLIASGPGSLPHHEAFRRAALFVHGGRTSPVRPLVRHLRLVLHNISQLAKAAQQRGSVLKSGGGGGVKHYLDVIVQGKLTYSSSRLRRWSMASSTSSGRPVTVTRFGSADPLWGNLRST